MSWIDNLGKGTKVSVRKMEVSYQFNIKDLDGHDDVEFEEFTMDVSHEMRFLVKGGHIEEIEEVVGLFNDCFGKVLKL